MDLERYQGFGSRMLEYSIFIETVLRRYRLYDNAGSFTHLANAFYIDRLFCLQPRSIGIPFDANAVIASQRSITAV